MAVVIGVPQWRGNSEVYRAVKLHKNGADFSDYFEGQAVFGGMEENGDAVAHSTFAANKGDQILMGFIHDINVDSGTATLIRSVEGVTLPATTAASVAPGEAISIDLATGKIGTGAAGERLTNATCIRNNNVYGVNGKTGAAVDNCINIRTNGAIEDLGPVA